MIFSPQPGVEERAAPDLVLRPGHTTLDDWRGIYRGAAATLDPIARADVEAGAAAAAEIAGETRRAAIAGPEAAGDMPSAGSPETAAPGPAVTEPIHDGDPLPVGVARLIVALKLASLAQGASGVTWRPVERLASMLAGGAVPALRSEVPGGQPILAQLLAAVRGEPEPTASENSRSVAGGALAAATIEPREKDALLSGAQVSTAIALAGLFEAESVLRSALVAGALSAEAVRCPDAMLHPRLSRLRRHRGRIDCAGALRRLLAKAPIRPAPDADAEPPTDPPVLHGQVELTGACLDLLRQAGETLASEANGVPEDTLVLWQSAETVSAGRESAWHVAIAADMIALALAHLGMLAERRIALLLDRGQGKTRRSSGIAALQSTASSRAAENRERARPASLPPDDDAMQSADGAPGVRRLLPMAGNVTLIVAIELMAAAEALEMSNRKRTTDALEPVRTLLRERVPGRGKDAIAAPDLAIVADLVRSGAVAAAAGTELPALTSGAGHLGVHGKRP